jgi:hypothetical protein
MLIALATAVAATAPYSAAQTPAEGDQETVYRQRPMLAGSEMVPVGPAEIKPGLAYNYYNRRLGRRVWGFAREDGTFQYAFGEGTMLPEDRFDLGLTPEQLQGLLEERDPILQQNLAITGASPSVVMGVDGQWRLLNFSVAPRVFDLETGHRWEWHGDRRAAVVHTYGDQWQVVDGRYVPLGGGGVYALALADCSGLIRAGSAMFLVRTPE